MSIIPKSLRRTGLLALVSALAAFSGSSIAAPLSLTDQPLFLATGVKPNIILAVDDSGSMDAELLLSNNDGAAWWRTSAGGGCPQGFVGCGTTGTADTPDAGRTNFNHAGNADGTWKKYIYLFPIGTGATGLRVYNDSTNDHFALPPLPSLAWTRSPQFNSAYFNPAETYDPWQSYGSTTFGNASPAAAPTDPTQGATVVNLTADRMSATSVTDAQVCSGTTPGLTANHQFRMYPGMVIPRNTCFRVDGGGSWQIAATDRTIASHTSHDPTNLRTTPTGAGLGVAIRYFPATFYLSSGTTLPAGYGWTGTTLSGTGPNNEPLVGYELKEANFTDAAKYQAAIQNFANWWTYYRKRHAATRGGVSSAFNDIKSTRVGSFTINNRTAVTMRDLDVTADRNSFYSDIYGYVGSGGTPNREAVHHMGGQLNRTGAGAPITHSCQKNFGILFTDGFSNNSTPAAVGNIDGSMGSPFQDSVSNTTADYATNFYLNRLRTDLTAGQVPAPAGCSVSPVDPRLDCRTDLHMSFFAVTLGTRGLIYNVNMAQTNDPFANPPTWPTTFPQRHPSAVDDLWHATLNTRGEMLNAQTPKDVGVQLSSVLRTISDRSSSASSASVNSGSISSDTRIYQAKFNSATWTGQLLAFPLDVSTGDLQTVDWDASDELPAAAARQIITVNSNQAPVAFRWGSLDGTRKTQLDSNEALLNYLRGDESNEMDNGGTFRNRKDGDGPNKLGDIVSSSPLFVGPPSFRYRESLESASYSAFASANSGRTPMVYVGANDGMLHGFNAETGAETFGFIPSPVFSRLKNLASTTYSHEFFVDGPPSMGDVVLGGAWHTVLVGGLNKGGKGIYALDITNPATLAAAETTGNPGSIVLWEFTEADDADLGLTYSQPSIVKLRDGRWAAVFGNGYNSASGKAVLYIVDIANGNLIKKFDTGVGTAQAPSGVTWDNGLSTPALVDTNADRVVEYAYAGDLYGNMWKFDLSAEESSDWKIAFGVAGGWMPLYQARDTSNNAQPITVRPEITRGPGGAGMVVLFGTGKFLEQSDKSTSPERRQTFYGIIDENLGSQVNGRGDLTAQSIISEQTLNFDPPDPDGSGPLPDPDPFSRRVRATSDNAVTNSGWYLDLVSPVSGYQAEKQVTNPIVRNGNVIFTTLIPDADPCKPGGTSWIMELNVLNGARLDVPPFDINNDGKFTDADNVEVTVDGETVLVPVSGIGSTEGILQAPGVIDGQVGTGGVGSPVQYKYLPGSSGSIQRITENPGASGVGRQSWRQIR